MNIGIITTHSFPIPTPTHTGDVVIIDLAKSLDEMGHRVTLYAPSGTWCPPHGRVLEMPCSYGNYPPSSIDCEQGCFDMHADELRKEDIIHDFSITKKIAENLFNEGKRNILSSPLGGTWLHPNPPYNITCFTRAMKERALRGATDYENTPTPDAGGPPQTPIKDARVAHLGVDTDWYTPTYEKKNFFLWMNRWHPAKGYKEAIMLAKKTGINLVMAGEHPDREKFEYQKNCALDAVNLAKDSSNISFEWLPADPDHHNAKRELYRNARALIYSVQFQEPFGLSQVEAMSCGTPVIGTNYGSVSEVITNGVTGYVCENNTNDFSIALALIDDINLETCREHAVMRFDRRVMAKAYLAEYKAIISGRGWGL